MTFGNGFRALFEAGLCARERGRGVVIGRRGGMTGESCDMLLDFFGRCGTTDRY